jgi:hypothetical protein
MADPPKDKSGKPDNHATEERKGLPDELAWLPDHARMRQERLRATLERLGQRRQSFHGGLLENVYGETDEARVLRKYRERDALQILNAAAAELSLNPPRMAHEINAYFARKRSKQRVDRTTVYRILNGFTKKPNPATVNALIHVLKLSKESAQVVRRQLGLTKEF